MLTTDNILQERYRIICQLGHGGMGAVYEAQDNKRFNAPVALKEILIDLANITDAKQQDLLKHAFEREAKILAEVQHEVFPHVIEYFSEGDRQYLVMELVQGVDLAELLTQRKTPFSLEELLQWTGQLLDALDYLHSFKPPIFHRDLKPQNLKLTSRGKIKLLDFGIAKSAETHLSTTITNQTFIAATLNYSPFEQILRVLDPTLRDVITEKYKAKTKRVLEQSVDARSDLYALGATLFHLSTGYVPTDALKRTLEVWSGNPDPLRHPHELNPNIPKEISLMILKAMEIDRENRFASAVEMQRTLNQVGADIKKREEAETRKREAAAQHAIRLAEQERLEKKWQAELIEKQLREVEAQRQLAEQERLRIEAEQEHLKKEHLEKERQLHEVEIQRQLAEQERLRIETEQKQLEKERQLAEQKRLQIEASLAGLHQQENEIFGQITQQINFKDLRLPETKNQDEAQTSVETVPIADGLREQSYPAGILPTPAKQIISFDISLTETDDLPFTLPESRKITWLLPVAVLISLMFGGAALGVWFSRISNTKEDPQQTNSNRKSLSVNEEIPKPTVETTLESDIVTPSTLSPSSSATPVSRPPVETKPAPPRVIKPTPQPTVQRPRPNQTVKPNPTPTITLDDIIKPRKKP